MVRRLHGRAVSRITNSPLQVGVQTCTRLLAFREIQGDLPSDKLEERFSATGRRGGFVKITAKYDIFGLCLVTSLTMKTSWRIGSNANQKTEKPLDIDMVI